MKKKILSPIMVMAMLISCVPIITHAAENGTCGDNLTWTLDNNGTIYATQFFILAFIVYVC